MIVPVVYHGTPPPGVTPKGVCGPGQYLDQTNGIFTCKDAHRARELSPHVKPETHDLSPHVKVFEPRWQRAW